MPVRRSMIRSIKQWPKFEYCHMLSGTLVGLRVSSTQVIRPPASRAGSRNIGSLPSLVGIPAVYLSSCSSVIESSFSEYAAALP